MIESLIEFLNGLPVWGVLLFALIVCYIENLVPPSPSDVLLLFCGTMVGIGTVGFVPLLIASTLGSVGGFATTYWIGRKYGRRLVDSGRIPFIKPESIAKVERWFEKYQGLIIVVNRFLAGTRGVVSFVAGLSRLPFLRTTLYCTLSATAWNALMIWLGMLFGKNWRVVESYIGTYGWVITGIIAVLIAWWLIRRWRASKAKNKTPENPT
ncbi:MAG: DedA family protein [bacterium]|nr:DedA family protein [bacterium]